MWIHGRSQYKQLKLGVRITLCSCFISSKKAIIKVNVEMSTLVGISVETCVLLCHCLNQSPLVQLNLVSKAVFMVARLEFYLRHTRLRLSDPLTFLGKVEGTQSCKKSFTKESQCRTCHEDIVHQTGVVVSLFCVCVCVCMCMCVCVCECECVHFVLALDSSR